MVDSGPEQRRRTFATNFHGPYRLTEKLLPLLTKSPNGAIVNVASQLGYLSQAPNADTSAGIFGFSDFRIFGFFFQNFFDPIDFDTGRRHQQCLEGRPS